MVQWKAPENASQKANYREASARRITLASLHAKPGIPRDAFLGKDTTDGMGGCCRMLSGSLGPQGNQLQLLRTGGSLSASSARPASRRRRHVARDGEAARLDTPGLLESQAPRVQRT